MEFKAASMEIYLPCLNWQGVSSRWARFLQFLVNHEQLPETPRDAFNAFAQYLGRVTSYRALALTSDQYQFIVENDSIWPTGRLRTSEDNIRSIIDEKGAKYICKARLYIGRGLLKYDPSLSLHDDGETAVTIAGGYFGGGKVIHLMELSVPLIEVLGYTVQDVSDTPDEPWFSHRGVWFNSTWERTERYVLYEIPFFGERLVSLRIISTIEEANEYIEGFKQSQMELYMKKA
eukprot:TRINITY_DN5479_c0_g1_i3.p1 TRINITY_DN5479_c0_g1~~TRINITY_DN5479_c0_g1_i3.p1  ORF type:complete len:233 (-),score=49.92 TRINITY_DN5479_c0_g1_i3:19-717(-)